ncbi:MULTISPECIES: esterase family protein [Paenibacillus]|uniref:Esterase family protein n=1 Tax=Paenibacillus campinasensis TaxID=66347 RepID=A0ABW9SYI8_9BACL|nr:MULTISPECIES: alpha/beta hydrolase-fold protein [Paenibacillus]MUG65897.1 esterase family protein [Paenibacillus campinasensis]PAK51691.1 enterochelin esterase [Paenibacillus sp. 7541]
MTNERLLKRTIVKEVIHSRHLQEDRTLRIYLPPGYNEVLSYPVVYCQDGEEFFNFGRIATWANQLILEEGYEPFIIVGVEVNTKVRTEEYAPFGSRFDAYLSCFAEEIIPFIEEKYPVRRDASERVLAGDSLGGSVSVHLALQYPELFTRVISLSGAFYEKSQSMISIHSDLSWLDVYMIVGLQEDSYATDTGVYNFVELNRTTRDLFEERGATVSYSEKDGRHIWGFWQKELPDALRYFLKAE